MKTFEEQEAKGVKFSEDHKTLLRVPTDFSGEYEIPDSVTKIGDNAFEGTPVEDQFKDRYSK